MSELFKQKLQATAYHAAFTLLVAGCIAYLIFFIWYPGAFAEMLRGKELYSWVLLVEVILGPCMSLVIYNANKPKRELRRDYGIVISIQLLALAYGIYTMALSRPVYIAFVVDRLEIVTPTEFFPQDLETAQNTEFNHFSWFGPKLVCTDRPNAKDRANLVLSSFAGRDLHVLPQYYRDCREGELSQVGQPLASLLPIIKNHNLELYDKLQQANSPSERYRWLPTSNRFGFGAVLIDVNLDKPVNYLNIDPYVSE